jgi:hypothetical protein
VHKNIFLNHFLLRRENCFVVRVRPDSRAGGYAKGKKAAKKKAREANFLFSAKALHPLKSRVELS